MELSCTGYRYGGIDWDHVRQTLEVYADKYMDRPQLLSDVLGIASEYAPMHHPENECTLGDLSLRFLFWLVLDPQELRDAVQALRTRAPQHPVEELLQESYDWFWGSAVTWAEVASSGWPLFSVLATVAERVRDDGQDACVPPRRVAAYVDSFDNAIYVPSHSSIATLLEAPECPEAVASALLSLADNHRSVWPPAEGYNRYWSLTSADPQQMPAEDDHSVLVARAEQQLRSVRSWRLLTSPWPVFRLLDRAFAAEMVNVTEGTSWFWMHVFPHRVRSDGIISNRIRATRKPYCLRTFQDEVLRLAAEDGQRRLRIVEAGPHIGDCMLWAAARLGSRALALAVEPVHQVVTLFRRSIQANNFNIELHHGFLAAQPGPPAAGHSIPYLSLDSLLAEDVHVLKIHTNGGERGILDGAANLFDRHKVHVVLVHSAEPDELWGSAEFLLQRGYRTTTHGQLLTLDMETWLKDQVRRIGGMQLHALAT